LSEGLGVVGIINALSGNNGKHFIVEEELADGGQANSTFNRERQKVKRAYKFSDFPLTMA
jgi:hypothetical protein